MRVLFVEDDRRIAEPVAEDLRRQGYTVDVALDGESGLAQAEQGVHDVLVLDVMLPHIDGRTIARRVRASGSRAVILLATARDAVDEKVAALDDGVDDYLVKPYDLGELSARIRAAARRAAGIAAGTIVRGSLEYDPAERRLLHDGVVVTMTRSELRIVEAFLRQPGVVFTRAMLLEKIDAQSDESTIKTHIVNIRRKLREAGARDELIENVYGIGYRLAKLAPA